MFKQKNILFWGIIIAVAFSLYYFSLNRVYTVPLSESHKVEPIPSSEITPTQQATTSPSPAGTIDLSPSAIANWSVCRNEKYGYEFKYPNGWYVYEHIFNNSEIGGYLKKTTVCEGSSVTLSQHPSIRGGFIPVTITVFVQNIEEWERLLIRKKELNTKTGIKFTVKEETVSGQKIVYYHGIRDTQATLFRDGKAFNLGVDDGFGGGEKLSLLDLSMDTEGKKLLGVVLSTFKFLN